MEIRLNQTRKTKKEKVKKKKKALARKQAPQNTACSEEGERKEVQSKTSRCSDHYMCCDGFRDDTIPRGREAWWCSRKEGRKKEQSKREKEKCARRQAGSRPQRKKPPRQERKREKENPPRYLHVGTTTQPKPT